MAKHTPGQWRAEPSVRQDAIGEWQVMAGNRLLADVGSILVREQMEQVEPNARLMAAAPDMLEALERLANIASTAARLLHYSSPEEAALFRKDEQVAHAAIAKAKGWR